MGGTEGKGTAQITADGLPRRFAPRNDEGGDASRFLSRNSGTAHRNAANPKTFVIASAARQSARRFRSASPEEDF
jgi:hypothetical protein